MRLQIGFGALSDSLADQVDAHGLAFSDRKRAKHLQRLADAIVRLSVAGVLTEGETHRARRRLLKEILSAVVQRSAAAQPVGEPDR